MWKKLSFWILGLMIGLLVLMSGGWLTARAADLNDHVTGSVTKPAEITEDGVTNPIDSGADLMAGQGYVLTYNWGIEDGQTINAGDTVTVTLPNTADYSNFLAVPTDVQLRGSDKPAGSMLPNPDNAHQLIITFNGNLSNTDTGRTGTIRVHVQGNKTNSSGSGGGSGVDLIRKNGWPLKYDYDENGYPTHIVWQITLNPDNKNLGDVTLTDQIGPYMNFHQAQQDTDPYKITTDPVLPAGDFSATGSGSTLVMKLKDVTKKVDIFYYTDIDPQYFLTHQQGNFSNSVGLVSASGGGDTTTDPGAPDGVPATQNIFKNYSWGASATIDGWYLGGFELTKTDADQSTTKLAGTVYTLQRESSKGNWSDYQTGLVTNAQGILRDISLEVGNYQLIETTAPNGYLVDGTPIDLTISAEDGTTVHELTQSDQPNGATLTKTDEKTKAPVPDATYRLVKSKGTGTEATPDDTAVVKDHLVTNAQGQVTVSKLAPGTYYFEETQAPDGYQLNSEPVAVTITAQDKSVQSVKQSDQPTEDSSSSSSSSSSTSSSTSSSDGKSSSSSSSSDVSSSVPATSHSKSSSSTTDNTQSGTKPDTSSTKTTNASSTTTKTQHQVVANVGTSSSSASTAPRHTGNAAGTTATDRASHAATSRTAQQRALPRTNGQRSLWALLIGFLILGLSLAGWRWHQSRLKD